MDNKDSESQITPETKISALLENFPQLEGVLMEMAPEFKKLKNPILGKTIARVTSLRQAAALVKIPLAGMINTLRREAGIGEMFEGEEASFDFPKEAPDWFSASRIVRTLDARAMLERGEQPIHRVFSECKNLKTGEIYELITPFLPVPLIEKAKGQDYLVWAREENGGAVKTYLTPR